MRIMMIGPYPRSLNRIDGGVASATVYLSQALVDEPSIDLIGVRLVRDGGLVSSDAALGWPVVDLSVGGLSLSTLYQRQLWQLRRLIRRYEPDVVHAQGVDLGGWLAVRTRLPSVVTVHGLLAECAKYQSGWKTKARALLASRFTEQDTVRRATDLICISPVVKKYYGSTISGRTHDIPNAIAPYFFDVERKPERGRLLFAGRLVPGKGVLELIRAVAASSEAVRALVLAGAAPDATYETALREEVCKLGILDKVVFAGFLDEHALLQEFARAEALVLPSFQETAPMVIQQAMASGLAVVATNVGGVPDQIRHGESGLLFEPGDTSALASCLRALGENPTFSVRLGAAARAVALVKYRPGTVARATRAIYESAIDGNQGMH